MSSYPKHFPVGWEELHRNDNALAWRLIDTGPWQGIIAITRGGMVPAAIVARELNIRIIETVSVIGYGPDDRAPHQSEQTKIVKQAATTGDGTGWLVIDDLVDTGRTIDVLRSIMPKAHYATVYAKPLGRPLVDTIIT